MMGKIYDHITDELQQFIASQHMFFVATATADSRINLSPKGLDSFRVVNPTRVMWLNLTGSGNETSAHLQQDGRMTVMFNAFTGKPMILRLYGRAEVIHPGDSQWTELSKAFPVIPGARQLIDMHVEAVQTSCGMAVPRYDYVEQRSELVTWARKKGPAGVQQYWRDKNQTSLDGIPTHIMEKCQARDRNPD